MKERVGKWLKKLLNLWEVGKRRGIWSHDLYFGFSIEANSLGGGG